MMTRSTKNLVSVHHSMDGVYLEIVNPICSREELERLMDILRLNHLILRKEASMEEPDDD